jgi:hypothetical protein
VEWFAFFFVKALVWRTGNRLGFLGSSGVLSSVERVASALSSPTIKPDEKELYSLECRGVRR